MWWSVNREEFLARPGAESKPASRSAQGEVRRPSADLIRLAVIPALLSALADNDATVRDAAAIAIGRCGGQPEVAPLIKALEDHDRFAVEGAVLGLGLIEADGAAAALIKVLNDPLHAARTRGMAALALGLSGHPAAKPALFDDLGGRQPGSVETSRALGAAVWAATGTETMAERSPAAAVLILRALKRDPKDREFLSFASAALSKTPDAAALPFILQGLVEARVDARATAAIAAGRIIRAEDKKSVRALIAALESERHTLPTRFMLIALGRIGGAEARAQLEKELSRRDKLRRAFAAIALGIAGATDVAPRMRQELEGVTETVTKGALIVGLGLMRDPDAFGLVAKLVEGRSNEDLLPSCMWFFALKRDRKAVPLIRGVFERSRLAETQEFAATALGVIGAVESQPMLINALLCDRSASPRIAAAIGLGRMGDERGIDSLVKIAAAKEELAAVRSAAVTGLGLLARTRRWPDLARVAIDSYFGIQNEPIDAVCTRAGGIESATSAGGAHGQPR